MEKSRLETKVGLFVLIGLVLLGALLVQFSKGTSLFRGTYTLRMHAANIGGLKVKSGVLLSGVQVGTVNHIQLDPSGTNVTILLRIYKEFPIYHDARFVIEQSGFLGDQYVSIIPTANTLPLLTNNTDVQCPEPFNLQEVARGAAGFIQRLDLTAKKLDASITDLRAEVLNSNTLVNFSSALTNLHVFTEQANVTLNNINNLIVTNGTQIDTAISNVVVFSSQLNQLGDSASAILATNGANLTAATKNIQDVTVTVQQFAADIQAGKGLAGTFLENSQVGTNLQVLAQNLSMVSSNLNRLGLWHILWSHPPPKKDSAKEIENSQRHP